MQRKTRLALIGAATAAVVAIGGVGIASADDSASGKNPFSNLLSRLVGDGTITQNQADAITKAMDEDRAAHEAEREARHQETQDAIAKALGLEWDAIETRLEAGETLAAIAGEKKDALIAALVAIETKHIDEHVADGRFTAEQAKEMKAGLTERVTAMVEGTHGPGRHGMRGPGMGGHHGFGDGDDDHEEGRGHHEDGFEFGPMGTSDGSDGDDA